jgi:hypothetical protein
VWHHVRQSEQATADGARANYSQVGACLLVYSHLYMLRHRDIEFYPATKTETKFVSVSNIVSSHTHEHTHMHAV